MYVWTDLGKPDGVCVCLLVFFLYHCQAAKRSRKSEVWLDNCREVCGYIPIFKI